MILTIAALSLTVLLALVAYFDERKERRYYQAMMEDYRTNYERCVRQLDAASGKKEPAS